MDFSDKVAALAQRIIKQREAVETEEATKNAFIMPLLSALGYDVFDPGVVVPEFNADVGIKKGEKVDYAVKIDGKVAILIECKPCNSALSTQHMSQLYRYFSVTEARFGILTNGIVYWFFTDLEQPNKMDARPFFEFNMLDYRPAQVEELKKFANSSFNIDSILETASDLKYGSLLMQEIAKEIDEPSEDVRRLLIGRVHEGKITANVMNRFNPLVEKAMKDTVRELVNQRISSAMDNSSTVALRPSVEAPEISSIDGERTSAAGLDEVVTSQEEIEAYQIVRAIIREVVKADRVVMRDAKSYCAILLDDNNRKPLCRLHFNRATKYIGLFDDNKVEERLVIDSLDDIFLYAERLKSTAFAYVGVDQKSSALTPA